MVEKKKGANFETPEDFDAFMEQEPESDDFLDNLDELETPNASKPKPAPKKTASKKKQIPPEEDLQIPEMEDAEYPRDMLDIAADIPVQVVAVIGKKNITVKEVAALRMGEVVELGRPANEVVDLVAGGKLIAKGELVEVEGKLGVKIIKMMR